MRNTFKGIVLHCSAGYSDVVGIQNYWSKNLGWASKGYAAYIEEDGTIWYLDDNTTKGNGYTKTYNDGKCWEFITNHTKGYNSNWVGISYQGGVEKKNTSKAFDSRTPAQNKSIDLCIRQCMEYFTKKRKMDLTKDFQIAGHRDFSPDKNGNGIIESWERIKECPSFDVLTSQFHQYTSKDRLGVLPYNKSTYVGTGKVVEYTVLKGDTLSTVGRRYSVTVDSIKTANSLKSDVIQVGQVLKIKL